jgi:hypothetical protein
MMTACRRIAALIAATVTMAAEAKAQDFVTPPFNPLPPLTSLPGQPKPKTISVARICDLIETNARLNSLPPDWFARLIWKESRFDAGAVSPAGAQGHRPVHAGHGKNTRPDRCVRSRTRHPRQRQISRRTAQWFWQSRLAAAAYNSGETRTSNWLRTGGFLPLETEGYVLDIMGEAAEKFADRSYQGTIKPLDPKRDFQAACRDLRVIMSRTIPMARIHTKPWGVQVAGNFRQSAAVRQFERARARVPALRKYDPVVGRVRSPMGRRGVYAVRIGVESRSAADDICRSLRADGGACVVVRNR